MSQHKIYFVSDLHLGLNAVHNSRERERPLVPRREGAARGRHIQDQARFGKADPARPRGGQARNQAPVPEARTARDPSRRPARSRRPSRTAACQLAAPLQAPPCPRGQPRPPPRAAGEGSAEEEPHHHASSGSSTGSGASSSSGARSGTSASTGSEPRPDAGDRRRLHHHAAAAGTGTGAGRDQLPDRNRDVLQHERLRVPELAAGMLASVR